MFQNQESDVLYDGLNLTAVRPYIESIDDALTNLRITENQAPPPTAWIVSTPSIERIIMQVRHFAHIATIATAALLSMGTAAQAQEIDRSETLQARNLAARQLANPWQDQQRTRAAVVAEVRNLQAAGQMKSVGERADAPVVSSVPAGHALTRAEVKSDLALWRAAHPLNSGERG